MAMAVANELTDEFQFYLAMEGEPSELTELEDEDQEGSIFLCTFPGLRRLMFVYVLKAKVELQSAFSEI